MAWEDEGGAGQFDQRPELAYPYGGPYGTPVRLGNTNEDYYRDYWTNLFRADPIMRQIHGSNTSEKEKERLATARAIDMGWKPASEYWSVDFDKDGFRTEEASFLNQTKAMWIAAGIAAGAGGALAAAGVGSAAAPASGAATGGSSAAIPTLSSTTYGTGLGTLAPTVTPGAALGAEAAIPTIGSTIYGTGMGTTAPTISPQGLPAYGGAAAAQGNAAQVAAREAAKKAPTAFERLRPYLINSGLQVGAALLAQRQINKAVEAQRQSAEQVMGVARDIYGQQRADQQPFLDMGTSGARTLGHLLGLR